MAKRKKDAALQAICPTCGAIPGAPCVGNGEPRKTPHTPRYLASDGIQVINDQAADDDAREVVHFWTQATLFADGPTEN